MKIPRKAVSTIAATINAINPLPLGYSQDLVEAQDGSRAEL
jgi:hypothetical protein